MFYNESKQQGLVFPDFISKSDNNIILDAKYKPTENINGSDYLQLLAYMFRFDSKNGYYIYPKNDENDNNKYELLEGSTFKNNVQQRNNTIYITKYGFMIPSKINNFNDFKEQIEKSEKKLFEDMK